LHLVRRAVLERDGFVLLLVWMYGGAGDARVGVDSHEQRLPACSIERVALVVSHSVSGPDDAHEAQDTRLSEVREAVLRLENVVVQS